jgi:SAM-dependent methyltransferase
MARNVEFCREHYPADCCEFIHCDASNPMYAPDQKTDGTPWPVEDDSVDLMTGLSVWTHLNEADSRYYLKEVGRVLKPGARAIITFFVLDGLYRDSLPHRSGRPGRYHDMPQDHWIFDQPTYGSRDWLHPAWTKVPEQAIGVTEQAMAQLLEDSGLRQVRMYPGNWKEVPGLYFQDVLVLQKGRRDAGND